MHTPCTFIRVLHTYFFNKLFFPPARLLGSCTFIFLSVYFPPACLLGHTRLFFWQNFAPCTLIWDCTFIRDTRVSTSMSGFFFDVFAKTQGEKNSSAEKKNSRVFRCKTQCSGGFTQIFLEKLKLLSQKLKKCVLNRGNLTFQGKRATQNCRCDQTFVFFFYDKGRFLLKTQ